MDRLAFPRQHKKVVPTQNEEKRQRDDLLPVGSTLSFHQRSQVEQPSQPKEEINKEKPGVQQVANPYEQPFTLEAALSLSLDDQTVPWYLQGYDLFMETRTSKYPPHSHTITNQ